MTKPTVFISYSHKDEDWKDLLRPHLKVLEMQDRITIWDDRQIDPGGKWFNEIEGVMVQAAVSVCLISADYLSSDFCLKEEIPYLLERCEKDGMILIPILIRPCLWKAVPWLKETQMLPRDGKSVSKDFKDETDEVFAEVAEYIFDIIDNPEYKPPESTPIWSPPEKIDIEHLPMTGGELFGRQKQLEMLDKAWKSNHTNIVSFVAWGGVGKSTMVNKWLERMATDNYRGARQVFAWSFHSQGTNEKVTSADIFIYEALRWFGDSNPKAGSSWDKGERLAELIRKEKTLLVLDGMEPLQSSDYERGKVRDPGMATFLSELARNNEGLCIITTREDVADLALFPETTCQENLEQVSAEAGRAILRISGVQGSDAELEAATLDFGYHAFALTLLGAYLQKISGHHISSASLIPDMDILEADGRHPRRMMEAFEKHFGKGPEVELLRMLGLFTQPAEYGAIVDLLSPPDIMGLNEHVQRLSEADWLRLLQKLRQDKLIAHESKYEPDILDCHPLIREHFGQKLKESNPAAWKEAHSRLYEYYKSQVREYPDTIEEMAPLYQAVAHGCEAGRHQEAMYYVFQARIRRRYESFSMHKLGAFGADLATLSGFFKSLWFQPVDGLIEGSKAYALNEAGFCLQALGRLAEAAQPMQAGLDARIAQEDWKNAAISAGNLSQIQLTLGNVTIALDYANKSVEYADRSADARQRMLWQVLMADVMHQTGHLSEAETAFVEAEGMQKEQQPEYPLLYSLQGFQYCDLLLRQGKYKEVLARAGKTLEWVKTQDWLLDIALDHLSLGCAHLLKTQQERGNDFTKAVAHLDKAVEGLRQSGQKDYLPRGLLARAELHRVQGEFEKARHDLDEATIIAERGSMRLHKSDCHLEYARLYLAMDKKEDARDNLETAKEMIEEMGYHRRDVDVVELEDKLL